jgi:hypothetical protein
MWICISTLEVIGSNTHCRRFSCFLSCFHYQHKNAETQTWVCITVNKVKTYKYIERMPCIGMWNEIEVDKIREVNFTAVSP